MTTAAERLALLAGTSGAAGVLLLTIGTGATAAEALVDYSGLPTATAAEHLLVDVSTELLSPARPSVFKEPRRINEPARKATHTSYVDDHAELVTVKPTPKEKPAAVPQKLAAGLHGGFIYTDLYLTITQAVLQPYDADQAMLDDLLLQAEQIRLKKLEMMRQEEEIAIAMLMAM